MDNSNNPLNNNTNNNQEQEQDPRRLHRQNAAMRSGQMPPASNVKQTAHSSLSPAALFRHAAVEVANVAQPPGFGSPRMPNTHFLPGGGSYNSLPGMPSPYMAPRQQWGPSPTMVNPNVSMQKPEMGFRRGQSAPAQGPQPTPQTKRQPQHPAAYGWNLDGLQFDRMDPYFPKGMIKLEVKPEDVDDALLRMQRCFQDLSIQADFEDSPAGARLRTLERIELYIVFFKGDDGSLSVDIQTYRGDYIEANRYIHRILDAAKGVTPTEPACETPSARNIREFESFLNRYSPVSCADAPKDAGHPAFKAPTPEESLDSTMKHIHGSLTSPLMHQRKAGFDNLRIFTDLEKTLSETAIASALVVVAGVPPAQAYKQQCEDVHRVIVRVLTKRDFAGDDTGMYPDMDADVSGFLSSDAPKTEGRSRYYDQYMDEMFYLTLNILSNSLEVLRVFSDDASFDMGAAVSTLNGTCEDIGGKNIVETLMPLVGKAKQRMPDACLACRSMRHLVVSNADLNSLFRGNRVFREFVKEAVDAGAVHAKLLSEAKKLQESF